ncbi:UNVERIFIED_CONTAM: hypothetical protein Slati_2172700 [Sesamum latifolium]|uniref:Uncharacterized protein n=1 Tax=Sesamum latifolium TaxID=2727402 RepID=A0AAW2WST9_9LAMI
MEVPPPSSLIPPDVEVSSSPFKCPRIEKVRPERTSPAGVVSEAMAFPAPVLTPRWEPKANAFNMSRIIHRSDVDKYEVMEKSIKAVHSMVQESCHWISNMQQRFVLERSHSKDLEAKLREIAHLKPQVEEKDGQLAMTTMENEVLKSTTLQAYNRG